MKEIALYNEFTIYETMRYFGLLYNMKMQEIKERNDFLISFLDLPPKERIVKNLR
jgi:ABC-type Na+ transport system ATPase subunit NatA